MKHGKLYLFKSLHFLAMGGQLLETFNFMATWQIPEFVS